MTDSTKTISASFTLARENFVLDVSFTIPSEGVTAIFGSSGSGKTTLLRCLAGLEKPDQGQLTVRGQRWQDETFFLPVHKRAIGYVFQESNLFKHLNVEHNLQFGFKRIASQQQRISFKEAITLMGLGELLTRFPAELSGGQRQRVAIARALLTSPDLLLMDEPLASLDIHSKGEILPYLEALNNAHNIPIIYVSHSPDEVVRIADHMLLLDHGKVRAQGEVNTLLTRADLPLAHLDEASAVVNGKVIEHDKKYHLTYLQIAGGKVAVSYKNLALGRTVKVRILARDVSLALELNKQSSISNVFPVTIANIVKTNDPAKAVVQLDMAGERLLAKITYRSVDILGLRKGQRVYAQIKSVALME